MTSHGHSPSRPAVLAMALLACSLSAAQAGPIAPDSLSGLVVWYKADSGVLETGGAVYQWQDGSAPAYNMAQGTAAFQPALVAGQAGGLASVRFDGSDDYMTAGNQEVHSNTAGMTVIAVVRPDTTAGGIIASKFNFAQPHRQWRLFPTGFDVQEVATAWDGNTMARTPFEPGAWQMFSGVWAPGTAARAYRDSRLMSTALQAVNDIPDTSTSLLLGAGNLGTDQRFGGMISEVVIFNLKL